MENMKLWENGTPYYNAEYGQPETTVTPYLVEDANPDKGLVIVCPGGGYSGRAEHEGKPIAEYLNKAGISALVLNYRVAPYQYPAELEDAKRSIRFARFHAKEWNVDPEKIGIIGFSAGGHLALMACEHFDFGKTDGDEIDRVSSRPNAGLLGYPVVSMVSKYTHLGSKNNYLGTNASDAELAKRMSGECSVPDDCPPFFIWHTTGDTCVDVNNSLMLAQALHEKNISFEMHIFPIGGHGGGLALQVPPTAQWAPLMVNWLKYMKF